MMFKWIFHVCFNKCFYLERSCYGVTGIILKCSECGKRFKVGYKDLQSKTGEKV